MKQDLENKIIELYKSGLGRERISKECLVSCHYTYKILKNNVEMRPFRRIVSGILSPHYKGNKVGYWGIHDWLKVYFGKANCCENDSNHKSSRFEWANLSGEYKRGRNRDKQYRDNKRSARGI
ncbi:MAG: hypothetical protein AAB706_04220, partial [Patescibacteria group bacterium]